MSKKSEKVQSVEKTKEERSVMQLPCKLTSVELSDCGQSLARKMAEIDNKKAECKVKVSEYKGQIDALEKDCMTIRQALVTGEIEREVEVVIRWDKAKGKKVFFRTDNWSEVKTVKLTEEEMQENIFEQ